MALEQIAAALGLTENEAELFNALCDCYALSPEEVLRQGLYMFGQITGQLRKAGYWTIDLRPFVEAAIRAHQRVVH